MARAARLAAVVAVLAASAVEVLGARVSSYAGDGAALTVEGDGGEEAPAPAPALEVDAPEDEVEERGELEVEVNLTEFATNRSLAHWEAAVAEEAKGDVGTTGAWKWGVRHRIWEAMERENVSAFPRPVHFRTPSFVGAAAAVERATQLPEFQAAKVVLVNAQGATRLFRKAVLEAGKLLVIQTWSWSRRTTSHTRVLDPAKIDPSLYWNATRVGKTFGEVVNWTAGPPHIDLVVFGSVAVSGASGVRVGAGRGTDDISYALLREMGAIGDGVPILTLVHDMQVVDDLPSDRMESFDVPVDIICTPNATLRVEAPAEKPKGIMWEFVQNYLFGQSADLAELKAKLEAEAGVQFANATRSIRVPRPLTRVQRKKRAGGNAMRAQHKRGKRAAGNRAGGNLTRAARRRGGGNLTNATQRKGRKKGGVRKGNRTRANNTRGRRPARVKSPEEAEAAPAAAVE